MEPSRSIPETQMESWHLITARRRITLVCYQTFVRAYALFLSVAYFICRTTCALCGKLFALAKAVNCLSLYPILTAICVRIREYSNGVSIYLQVFIWVNLYISISYLHTSANLILTYNMIMKFSIPQSYSASL